MVRKVTLKSQQQHQNQQKGKGRVQKQKSQFVKKWVVQKIISSRKNQYEHYPGYQDELEKQKQLQQEEQKKQMEKLNKDRSQVKKLQKQRKNKIDKQKLNKIMKANQIQIGVKNQTQSKNIIKQTIPNKNEQKTEQFSASKTRQGTKFHDSQKLTQNKDQKKTVKKDPKNNQKQQNKQQTPQSTKTEKKTPIQQQKITKKIQKTVKKKQDTEKTKNNDKNNNNNNIINNNNIQKTKKKSTISSPQPRAKELNEFINQGKFKTYQQQQQQQLQQQNGKCFKQNDLESCDDEDDEFQVNEKNKQNESESESEQIIKQISESESEFEDEDEDYEKDQGIGQNTQQQLKELQDYLNNQEGSELSENSQNQEQYKQSEKSKKHTKYSPKKEQNKNDAQIQQVRRSPRLHKEIENEIQNIDSKQNKKDCQKKLFIKKCEEEEQEEKELLNVDKNKNISKQKQNTLEFDQIDIEEQKMNQKIKNIDEILEKCKKIQQKSRKNSKNQDQINKYNENGQSVLTFKTPLKKNNSNIILKKQNSAFSISSLDSATNFNNKNQNLDNKQTSNIILNNSNIISENESTKNILNYKNFNREAVKQNFIIDSPFVSEQNLDLQNKNYNQNQQQLQQSHRINDSNDSDIQEIQKNSYLVNLTKKQDKNQGKWTKNYFSKESIYSPLTNKYNEKINLQKQIKPIQNEELNSEEEQETENQFQLKNDKFTKQNQKNQQNLYSQTSSSSSEKFIDNNIEEEIKDEEEKVDQQQNLSKLKDFQNQIEDINLLRNCKNLQIQIDELHQYALNMKQISKKKSPLFKNNLNKSLSISSKLNQYNANNNNKNSNHFVQNVDVAFCIDATKGMEEYIEKTQNIIFTLFQKCLKNNIDLKIALVFYRDHPPEEESFVTRYTDCTNNITNLIQFLKSIGGAQGGGDIPEAVLDGLYDSLKKVNWRASALKYIIHIGDAPPHGDFYTGQLSIFNRSFMWRDGCPCGLTIEKIAKLINNYKFRYRLVKIGDNLQLMSKIFKQNIQDFKEIKINSSKNLDKYISGMIISETCFFEDIE